MPQSMIITNLPQSMIITNLPGPLLHRYALDTQNAIWMKGSLPDTSVVWFGCVAGVFRFGFWGWFFFFFGSCFNEVEAKPNSRLCKWGKINAKLENE